MRIGVIPLPLGLFSAFLPFISVLGFVSYVSIVIQGTAYSVVWAEAMFVTSAFVPKANLCGYVTKSTVTINVDLLMKSHPLLAAVA